MKARPMALSVTFILKIGNLDSVNAGGILGFFFSNSHFDFSGFELQHSSVYVFTSCVLSIDLKVVRTRIHLRPPFRNIMHILLQMNVKLDFNCLCYRAEERKN